MAKELRRDYHVIAPDLRGHGDSQWSSDGNYAPTAFVLDLAQLIDQQKLAPVTIVAHSLGGNIAVRYAGIYPENVTALVAIEGLGRSPKLEAERARMTADQRLREWIDDQRAATRRPPRRYASIDEALARMQAANRHLGPEQVRHLTLHGTIRNEDGSYSWKFDNYVRPATPLDLSDDEIHHLWSRIDCPTLLVYGRDSWASNPAEDGRLAHFRNARVALFKDAGHWVHHDQLDAFVAELRSFLRP